MSSKDGIIVADTPKSVFAANEVRGNLSDPTAPCKICGQECFADARNRDLDDCPRAWALMLDKILTDGGKDDKLQQRSLNVDLRESNTNGNPRINTSSKSEMHHCSIKTTGGGNIENVLNKPDKSNDMCIMVFKNSDACSYDSNSMHYCPRCCPREESAEVFSEISNEYVESRPPIARGTKLKMSYSVKP